MKATIGSLIVVGIALTGWAGASQAAPVVADFTAGPGDSVGAIPPLTLDLGGGLEVTVTAATHAGGPGADAPFPPGSASVAFLHRNDEGVGVRNPTHPNDDVGGFGAPELLTFTFNQSVALLSVVFENITGDSEHEGPSQFDMAADDLDIDVAALLGTDDINEYEYADAGFGNDSYLADFADAGLTGTVFQFYTTDLTDTYRIRQFLVEAAGDDGGADVVAPPALLLLGLGLAGLGVARHRRR